MRLRTQQNKQSNQVRTRSRGIASRLAPRVDRLEDRVLLANAVPATVLTLPAQALIGSTLNFSVDFSNASPSQTGFGPYVDLELPTVGANGNNGISFGSASYLGVGVTSTVLTFDLGGHARHPYAKTSTGAPVVVSGTPGDQLVVLALPFGSVTPGQPAAKVDLVANLSNYAQLGTGLNVKVEGGFRYGNDALDNPGTDPSLVGAQSTSAVSPTLVLVKTTYVGPEDETATGVNFPRQYLVTATVAPGQVIQNLELTDLLPSTLRFLSVDAASANGSTQATTVATPSLATPGGTLTERFDQVVGTGGPNDVSLRFSFVVPRDNSSSNPVLDLGTGIQATSLNQASASGTWTPLNPAFSTATVTSNVSTHTLQDKSLAVQKLVTDLTHPGAPRPGDVLSYSINFQVSDYFAFQSLIASDAFSDGQHFDPSFTPTLSFSQHGTVLSAASMQLGNFNVGTQDTSSGSTTISFDVSSELAGRGVSGGRLMGGSIPAGGTGGPKPSSTPSFGATTGTITFHTIVQQKFDYHFPSGEPYVDQGDLLTNSVSVTANLVDYANLAATASSPSDTSSASVKIPRGALSESVYAVNGTPVSGGVPKITAGDTVTYRIQFELPNSNIENLALSAFLPLPVFAATELTAIDNTQSGTAPVAGHVQFGPNDTYHSISGIIPSLGTSATANSVNFDYGTYHDPGQRASTVDLLYTVTTSSSPFADGLFLTNQVHESEGSTNNGSSAADAIVLVQLTEPNLVVSKGAVAVGNAAAVLSAAPFSFTAPGSSGNRFSGTINSTNLASTPIDASVSGVDAGDLVTFAIVVQNLGAGPRGAYDVTILDALPSGFVVPAGGINLHATDGAGTALAFSNIGGGSGLLDQGIRIQDGEAGALSAYDATNGKNVLVITYDLQVASTATAKQSITNTASLTNFAAVPGGADFLATPLTATATATLAGPSMSKSIIATNQGFTSGTKLAIGEIATYSVVITVPEGVTPASRLVDTLPSGLGIVSIDSITPSSGLISTSWGTWAGVLASHTTVGSQGSSATIDFGTITNTDTDNGTPETITVQYRLAALNVAINANNAVVRNSAAFSYAGGSVSASAAATIVTPLLRLTMTQDKSTGQAGDTITYTVTLTNVTSNGSGTNGYDVSLTDVVPSGIDYVAGSLRYVTGLFPALDDSSGSPVTHYSTFPLGNSSIISFQGKLNSTSGPYQSLVNTSAVNYSTLPGVATTPQSSYVGTSTERTGSFSDPGGTANNLSSTKTTTLTTVAPTVTKTIQSTSLSTTSGTNVAIGEQAQYTINVIVPNGTASNAKLTDTLPSGMALVSLDSFSASGLLGTSVSGGFDAVVQNAGIGSDGGTFTLDFGTLLNSSLDSSVTQTMSLTFTAIVLNTAGNVSGTALQNKATFSAQGGSTSANAPNLTVVLPKLALVEAVDKPIAQAGDIVTYTVTLSNLAVNGSGEDAYDVSLSDLIPTGMSFISGSIRNPSGLSPTTSGESAGRPVITFSDMPLGSLSTLTFQAQLLSTTGPYQTLSDAATAEYSTLPGSITTAQSSFNIVSTERTGNTNDPGGVLNSLTTTSSASVSTRLPSITKTIIGTSLGTTTGASVAIGEVVHYELVVTIPNGVSANSVISDSLPSGLALMGLDSFTADELLATSQTGGFSGAISSVAVGSGGNSFSIDLATITNSNLDSSKTQTITLDYSAVVLNTSGNIAGTSLQNTAGFAVQGGSKTASAPSLTVVEPHLSVAIAPSSTKADAGGQPVTFTVTISASAGSGADANDVVLSDLIPSEYNYVASSFRNAGGVAPDSISDSEGNLSASFNQLSPGANSVFTFEAVLSSSTTPGSAVSESVRVTYSSLPGIATNPLTQNNALSVERTGSSSDLGGIANNYAAVASTSVTPNENSIGGRAFVDTNHNGAYDSGESLLSNVPIALTGLDNLGSVVTLTTTTDQTGKYNFGSLRPGTYSIASSGLSGYLSVGSIAGTPFSATASTAVTISSTLIPMGANSPGTGYDFILSPPSSISGKVFSDLNNDGVLESGESGISSVSIVLTGTDRDGNHIELSTTTDSLGVFRFSNLKDGRYSLAETQPLDYLQGTNSVGLGAGTFTGDSLGGVDLAPGADRSGILFAELLPASVSGSVYVDLNDDGILQHSEAMLGDVLVTLTGIDDGGGQVSLTTLTVNGTYEFAGLRPGTYAVTEATPSGLLDGKATPGTPGGGSASGRDLIVGISLSPSDASASNNLGVLPPASLAGIVYLDANADGTLGLAELGSSGVTITLHGVDDFEQSVTRTTISGVDGGYSFGNLHPGVYQITVTVPQGDFPGKATVGTLGGTATILDRVDAVAVSSGVAGTSYNLALILPASAAGFVYLDADSDGRKQASERGAQGVRVTLSGTDDLGGEVTYSVQTGEDGSYQFTDLRPGIYSILEHPPTDSMDGGVSAGTKGGDIRGRAIDGIPLIPGDMASGYDFAVLIPSSIEGLVFLDTDNDGIHQLLESGLEGVTVSLTGVDDLGRIVNRSIATNSDGGFRFEGLRPGEYELSESNFSINYLDGSISAGKAGGLVGMNQVDAIRISAAIDANGYMFAHLLPSEIAGLAFDNKNNDGMVNGTDAPIRLTQIFLTGIDDRGASISSSIMTTEDGRFRFGSLRPGTYSVASSAVSGLFRGKTAAGPIGGAVRDGGVDNISIVPDTIADANLFAYVEPVALSGRVYLDPSRSGNPVGAAGLAGVSIRLTGIDDRLAVIDQTLSTDSEGSYLFESLRPGEYALTKFPPAAYADGAINLGSAGGSAGGNAINAIVLFPGQIDRDSGFAEIPAAITGTVFVDLGANGTFDSSDPVVPNAIVTAYDKDHVPVATTISDENGFYEFRGLTAGLYVLIAEADSPDGPRVIMNKSLDVPAGRVVPSLFPLNIDNAVIRGTVFSDANNDGIKDEGESPVGGVTVILTGITRSGEPFTKTAVTDSEGRYRFDQLREATYTIADSTPAGYFMGKGGGVVSDIATRYGRETQVRDLPLLPMSSILGSVFLDVNNNNNRDAVEFGIAHVLVTLTGIDDLGGKILLTRTTDANGAYSFTGLRPGMYSVSRSETPLFAPGGALVGNMGGVSQQRSIVSIPITPSRPALNYDFCAKVRPGCVLTKQPYYSLLLQGPNPAQPTTHLGRYPIPSIKYWLPAFSQRLWTNIPVPRGPIAHQKGKNGKR